MLVIQLVECRVRYRKVAKPSLDSRCSSALLCPWERLLIPTLGPSSLPVVVAQPDERHENRSASVLEWYNRHTSTGLDLGHSELPDREGSPFGSPHISK